MGGRMIRSNATSTRPTPANSRIADTTLSDSVELSSGTSTRLCIAHLLFLTHHASGRGANRQVGGGHSHDRCLRSMSHELSDRVLHHASTAVGGHQGHIW